MFVRRDLFPGCRHLWLAAERQSERNDLDTAPQLRLVGAAQQADHPVKAAGRLRRVPANEVADRWQARLTGPQGSGILSSMVLADALIQVPPDTQLPAGAEVEALFLREL